MVAAEPRSASRTRVWLLVCGVWSAVALFSVAQIWVARAALGHPPPLVPLLVLEVPIWAYNPYPMLAGGVYGWFWEFFRRYFIVGVVLYWAVIGVFHAFTNYFRYREGELEASRAKAQLTEARLQALRMQLHPHFLFNTLNSASALMGDRPAEARRALALEDRPRGGVDVRVELPFRRLDQGP